MVSNHISYPASDRSYFALLRKGIHKQALVAGFNEKKIAHLDLIVAEITSNLGKHTTGGEVLCAVLGSGNGQYIEIISIDNGRGMPDVAAMMKDGVSTANTLGNGLGSIKRLSDFFCIYSLKDWGTILLSRIYKDNKEDVKAGAISVYPIVLAKPGETLSGDGLMYKQTERYFKMLLLDGLGHGPEANKAVVEANNNFKLCPSQDPVDIIRFLHGPLKKTRGGVGTVLVYDIMESTLKIAGVGNIASRTLSATDFKNVMSYNGIIGHNIPNTMNSHVVSGKDFRFVILCSDGIKSRWDLTKYPLIIRFDPTIIAAAIYKDFGRLTDDMSVAIVKLNR